MILDRLELIDDPTPWDAAWNMALDEALLEGLGDTAILRVYRWARPAISFGYFESFAPVETAYSHREWVRRWTGGGVVEHGADFTYSLLAPRGSALARARPGESYRLIHQALAEAAPGVEVAAADAPKISRACFENPVCNDLLLAGRKVAGAAQRRTRAGLLHQGSVRLALAGGQLAAALARDVSGRRITARERRRAGELVESRYGTAEWLRRRA